MQMDQAQILVDTDSATQGKVKLNGIQQDVEIHRDRYGVPHIFAHDDSDAAFGLGYAHGQDRFFQMDLLRKAWQGRQSEIFGQKTLAMDKLFRLLRTRQRMQAAWNRMPPDDKIIFERYAAGVNAATKTAGSAIHSLLKLQPEPWTALDSLGIIDLLSWQTAGNFETELVLAKISGKLGPEKARMFMPTYPANGPFMIEQEELPEHLRIKPGSGSNSEYSPVDNKRQNDSLRETQLIQNPMDHLLAVLEDTQKLPIGAGSNAWVVSPDRSATGKALYASDPHLSITAPSPWYHANLKTSDREAIGFTMPGLPLVLAGHNTFCAFGFTVNNTDAQDLYIEKLNPNNDDSYQWRGEWRTMETEEETILVRGQKPVKFVTRWTGHGPVISDLSSEAGPVMSLRWAVLETDPGNTITGFRRMMRSKSWQEWREAAMLLEDSPKNFVYADREGNIGSMVTGRLPLRNPGSGNFPVPGWDAQNEWRGFVPPDELPYSINPSKGFVASANEKPWPKEYKHDRFLNGRWAHPYRQMRIVELLKEKQDLTVLDMKAMQLDVKSTLAPLFLKTVLPALKGSHEPDILWAAKALENWDFHMVKEQLAPTLYHAMYIKTARNVFIGQLGEELAVEYIQDQYLFQERLRTILQTSVDGTHDDLFRQSMKDALAMLRKTIGPNHDLWTWGRLHTVKWIAPPAVMVPELVKQFIFPIDPTGVDGGPDTLFRAKYRMNSPFLVASEYTSSRLIVDWSTPETSWAVNATGQCEDPNSPHQFDQNRLWLNGEYYPLVTDMNQLNTEGYTSLVLVPGSASGGSMLRPLGETEAGNPGKESDKGYPGQANQTVSGREN
jgi:penicillin amidase